MGRKSNFSTSLCAGEILKACSPCRYRKTETSPAADSRFMLPAVKQLREEQTLVLLGYLPVIFMLDQENSFCSSPARVTTGVASKPIPNLGARRACT